MGIPARFVFGHSCPSRFRAFLPVSFSGIPARLVVGQECPTYNLATIAAVYRKSGMRPADTDATEDRVALIPNPVDFSCRKSHCGGGVCAPDDGRYVAAAEVFFAGAPASETIRVFDLEERTETLALTPHDNRATALSFSSGKQLNFAIPAAMLPAR